MTAQKKYPTAFEKSKGKETATYEEVINYYQELSNDFPVITVTEKGLTDSGLPLHLVKMSSGNGEKLRILINNGIHPGEPDGIDASMMLVRDLVLSKNDFLNHYDIFIIPVYNIGGALNRNSTSRVNQVGPEEYGFRGNARNYDLNRDFVKADTRNTRSFYEIFHEVQPDIFIDTHVSNGADYQHVNTHLFTQHNKLNSAAGIFLYEKFIPGIEQAMIDKNDPMTPYVNVFNRTPESGFTQFMDWPRYSTGYTALFNTLGMMIETHMLKPYDLRVRSTYDFILSALNVGKKNKEEILELRDNIEWWPKRIFPLNWKLNESKADTIKFLGYRGVTKESAVTGEQRLFYDRNQPFEQDVPFYNYFIPENFVDVPEAYIVPQGWHNVVDLLLSNKADHYRLDKDTLMNVEVYSIEDFKTAAKSYEGHYPHNDISVQKNVQQVQLRKGDYVFPVHQRAGRYLMEVLEPQAHDSFFSWNFFDSILQRKEGFSPYIFEDIAHELLQNDPELRTEFEERKEASEEFRNNWYAQLQFIYERSEHSEKVYRKYPVYRIKKQE